MADNSEDRVANIGIWVIGLATVLVNVLATLSGSLVDELFGSPPGHGLIYIYSASSWIFLAFLTPKFLSLFKKFDMMEHSQNEIRKLINDLNIMQKRSGVEVEKVHSLSPILAPLSNAGFVKVFIGVGNLDLIKEIVSLLKSRSKPYYLYVHPRILRKFMEVDPRLSLNNVHPSPCPLEQCSIFISNNGTLKECIIIRFLPEEGFYWTASVKENREFLTYMEKTYDYHYVRGTPQRKELADKFDALCFAKVAEERIKKDEELHRGEYFFANRILQYEFASELVKSAESCILAIDGTPPSQWLNQDYLKKYLEENAVAAAPDKRRVHIYDQAELKNSEEDYEKYINLMREFGIDISFLEKRQASRLGISAYHGFVILDRQVMFLAYDDRSPSEEGVAYFDQDKVKDYCDRFNKIYESPERKAGESFLEHIRAMSS